MNADILSFIFSYINDGYTYKATIFTCKDWYNIIQNKHPNLWKKCCNMLMTILKFYPDKPWNWFDISRNTNLTMDMINNNPDKSWDWEAISRNPNIINGND